MADSYHYAFAVACVSLIISIIIYWLTRSTFAHADRAKAVANGNTQVVEEELTPAQTKERIVCLCLVFAVVIFFWMAFHQNGITMNQFAREYTAKSETGFMSLFLSKSLSLTEMRSIWNLVSVILVVYGVLGVFQVSNKRAKDFFTLLSLVAAAALIYTSNIVEASATTLTILIVLVASLFSLTQTESGKGKIISSIMMLAAGGLLVYRSLNVTGSVEVEAPIFQQFNPCFVVALTPIVVLIFSKLAQKGKEPTSPTKIGMGMLVAASAFVILLVGSWNLPNAEAQKAALEAGTASLVSPNWLISTYLVLTIAELLLSPIGISFVSKVAPPKLKGTMMGGWFVAPAVGNMLIMVPGLMWGMDLSIIWGVLICICLASALFIFSILKKLNKVS